MEKERTVVTFDREGGGELHAPAYYRKWFRYNSPAIQVLITSLVAFGCPGMFNSLSGIGAGGQVDNHTTDTGNIALYSINAGVYLFVAPIVYHYIGSRWCMFFGGIAYPLYGGSLLAYNYIKSDAFVIAAAAILGIGSAHLWVGQGALMTGAPLPHEKGKLIGIYWLVFNMGGVIGSFIEMGVNWNSEQNTVSNATYAVFIALMGAGFLSALLLLSPEKIVRSDGSVVRPDSTERPNVVKDFLKILKIIPRKETLVLIPYFFVSNYCYSYQQNTVNGRLFDIRTRGFDGAFYWLGALSSPFFGMALDNRRYTRRTTATAGFVMLAVLHFIVFGGGLALQLRSPSNASDTSHHKYMPHALDMIRSHSEFAGPFILYFCYGIFDSLWQTYAYWIIGCLGTDDEISARYVGLYKSMQSVGAVVAWKLNSVPVNYDLEFALNWGFVGASLLVLVPLFFWIREPGSDMEPNYVEGVEIMPSVFPIRSQASRAGTPAIDKLDKI